MKLSKLGDSIKTRERAKKTVHELKLYQKKGIIKAITRALQDKGISAGVGSRVYEILNKAIENKTFMSTTQSILRKYQIENKITLPTLRRRSKGDYSEEYQEWFFGKALYIEGKFSWIPRNRRFFMIAVAELLLNPSLTEEQALLLVDNAVQDHLL